MNTIFMGVSITELPCGPRANKLFSSQTKIWLSKKSAAAFIVMNSNEQLDRTVGQLDNKWPSTMSVELSSKITASSGYNLTSPSSTRTPVPLTLLSLPPKNLHTDLVSPNRPGSRSSLDPIMGKKMAKIHLNTIMSEGSMLRMTKVAYSCYSWSMGVLWTETAQLSFISRYFSYSQRKFFLFIIKHVHVF